MNLIIGPIIYLVTASGIHSFSLYIHNDAMHGSLVTSTLLEMCPCLIRSLPMFIFLKIIVFRLFVGLMSVNPIFLLISICVSKVLVLCTFYYEYSGIWCISHPLDSR